MSSFIKHTKFAIYYSNNKLLLYITIIGVITGIIVSTGNWLYAGVLLLPVLIYLCMEKPFVFPFGVYALLIPFDSILSVTSSAEGTTLNKYLGILTLLVLLFKGAFENKLKWPDNAALWWILTITYGGASIFWAIEPRDVWGILPTTIGLLSLYLITSSYKIHETEFNSLKWFILLGGLLASLYLIYNINSEQFYHDTQRASLTAEERYTDPNYFAFTFIIPVSICIQMIINYKKRVKRVLLSIVLGIIVYSILMTGSRGGLLGIISVFLVYFKCIRQKILLISLMVIIGASLIYVIPDFISERYGGDQAVKTGGTGRLYIWYVGWKALGKYWAFGAGMNNFPLAFKEFGHHMPFLKYVYYGAHNIYLAYFVELGIIGLTLLAIVIYKHIKLIKLQFSSNSIDAIMLRASLSGILVSSFFIDTVRLKSFWLLWMIIMMHNSMNIDSAKKISSKY